MDSKSDAAAQVGAQGETGASGASAEQPRSYFPLGASAVSAANAEAEASAVAVEVESAVGAVAGKLAFDLVRVLAWRKRPLVDNNGRNDIGFEWYS